MSDAFTIDSRACAACAAWTGERSLARANTLSVVAHRQVLGECQGPRSPKFRTITRASGTCDQWEPLAMLRAHGGRPGHNWTLPVPATVPSSVIGSSVIGPLDEVTQPPGEPDHGYISRLWAVEKCHPMVVELFRHWNRARGRDRLPGRDTLKPWELRRYLGLAALFEVIDLEPVPDYRCLHQGAELTRHLGVRAAGRRLSDLEDYAFASPLYRDLEACRREETADCRLVETNVYGPIRKFVRLALPFAGSDGRAALILTYTRVLQTLPQDQMRQSRQT